MQVLQTRFFARFARKAGIRAADLRAAADRLANGLIDADLGGGLVKQRIARANAGGFRTILAFRMGDRAVFVYGFAKNERDNISAEDLRELRLLVKRILRFTSDEIATALQNGDFLEVSDGD